MFKSLTSLTVFQWTKCYITGLTLYANKDIRNFKQVVIRKAWNTSPKTEPTNENASNYTELTMSAAVATAKYANVDVDRQPRSDNDQTYVNTTAGMMARRVWFCLHCTLLLCYITQWVCSRRAVNSA